MRLKKAVQQTLDNYLWLTWCKPRGSVEQVHCPHSLLAAMTMPAQCQTQPWQQAVWGVMGACTYLMAKWVKDVNDIIVEIIASAVRLIWTHKVLPWEAVLTSLGILGLPSPAHPYAPTLTLYLVSTFTLAMITSCTTGWGVEARFVRVTEEVGQKGF